MRIYDYRCRVCGAEQSIRAAADPGAIFVCDHRLVHAWRIRPETPFVAPDTTGMVFGPKADELAQTGRPFARRRDEAADMGALAQVVPAMPAHVQEKLF